MSSHCRTCGTRTQRCVPVGDNRERDVCASCGAVHYDNPRPVAAVIVEGPRGLVLCRRAIEPRLGAWTTPGGFLEVGEGTSAGAKRETMEEACAEIEIVAPHALLDIPHIGQTYVVFRARLTSGYAPGPESLEVREFALGEIPWAELAFPVLSLALRWYVEESSLGVRHLHTGAVHWSGDGDRYDVRSYTVHDHLATRLS